MGESPQKSVFGTVGLALGATAFLLALIHFWAGPFSPQPTLEEVVAAKAVSIRDATIAALKGETVPQKDTKESKYDLDRLASIATAGLGGLAVVLGVVGISTREPLRVAGGAACLGLGAIAFQAAVVALGVFVLVTLVSAVLNGFSLDDLG